MSSLTVMLIRHGEKPGEPYDGPGMTPEGQKDDKSLIVRGWQRAGAWAALFGSGDSPNYPKPNVIYAAKPRPIAEGASYSKRPFQTAGPLADRVHLERVTKWGVGEEGPLVDEITKLTGVVLVFWEHKAIAGAIVPALRGKQSLPGVPLKWDKDRFDVVLRFDRALPDAPWSFRQLSPRLLDGDSEEPFARRES